jgi:hypothetical protein
LERKTFQVILTHWDGLKICSEAQAAIKIGRRKLNSFLQNDLRLPRQEAGKLFDGNKLIGRRIPGAAFAILNVRMLPLWKTPTQSATIPLENSRSAVSGVVSMSSLREVELKLEIR